MYGGVYHFIHDVETFYLCTLRIIYINSKFAPKTETRNYEKIINFYILVLVLPDTVLVVSTT